MVNSRWIRLLLMICVCSATGCSDTEGVTWSGKVTLDGSPLKNGTIRFEPAQGGGPTVGADIIDGNYTVQLTEGPKQVEITGYRQLREVDPDEYQNLQPGQPVEPAVERLIEHTETVKVTGAETRNFALSKSK